MNIVFTPASVLDLLTQIDELKEYDIGITETIDDKLQLQVGSSIYEIVVENAEEIPVPEHVANEVETINQETYEDLLESDDFEMKDQEPVHSGLLTTMVKSMLLGGAIKFIKNML